MKKITTIATALALSLAAPGLALAEKHHGHSGPPAATDDAGPKGDRADMMKMMNMMMPMMMKMHRQMMDGDMQGGMPGSADGKGMAMMDGSMMRMMMGAGMMGAPDPGAAIKAMQSRLTEFDADGDGALSLAEFETLHAAMIREQTVDRFQYFDADGDGRITKDEMTAPARRMEMRREMPGAPGMMDGRMPSGN